MCDHAAVGLAEFTRRFVAEMLQLGGERFEDGEPVRDYAEMTAPLYYEDEQQRDEGPEQCARDDISYWGE